MRSAPLLYERRYWQDGHLWVAGVDEVGCGCWAGDVVAGAVILPKEGPWPSAQDSKQLSPLARQKLAIAIKQKSLSWALGRASVMEIDTLNIRAAAFLAMRRALEQLTLTPSMILSDGFKLPGIQIPSIRLVGGDHRSRTIAAASIIAKVARDQELEKLDQTYPLYGFAKHKGYGTKQHAEALKKHGPCVLHRQSFAPVKAVLAQSIGRSS